jgi:hypothetical protein
MPRSVPEFIGFPPPLLGTAPVRLPVLAAREEVFALAKPAGIAWEGETGVAGAVRRQLETGKPELLALAPGRDAAPVWPLETDVAGIGLFAPRGAPLARWRNAFGSNLLVFTYEFLAGGGDNAADAFVCEMPVERCKSATAFRRVARAGRWSWWEARTDYPRFQQIRLHAARCGLNIVGETLPGAAGETLTLELLSPRGRLNKGAARPLHDGVCLRLARVDCSRAGFEGWGELSAPPPAKWDVLRKRLAEFARAE